MPSLSYECRAKLSSVGAVLDGFGGWHCVVAPRKSLRHHVRPGQILIIVPHFKVQEPVPFDDYAMIINRAELAALEWIGRQNDRSDPAIALFLLRRQRGFNRGSVNLYDIVET
jgi:hypothetical protein